MNESSKEAPTSENAEYTITDIISLLKKRKMVSSNIDSIDSIIKQQTQKRDDLAQVVIEIDKKLKDNISIVNEVAALLEGLVDKKTIDSIKSINDASPSTKETKEVQKEALKEPVIVKEVEEPKEVAPSIIKEEEVIPDILEDIDKQEINTSDKASEKELLIEKLRADLRKFITKEKTKKNPHEDYSKKIQEINSRIAVLQDELDKHRKENCISIYPIDPEEKRLFMPKHLDGDTRKTIVYIDLQNVINSIRFEPINLQKVSPEQRDKYKITTKLGDYKLYFYPYVISDILERYVWIYPNVEKIVIYSTPKWQSVNDYITEEIVQNNHPEVKLRIIIRPIDEKDDPLWKYKKFAGNYDDTDWDMVGDMQDDSFRSECTNKNYSRIIIISGDKVFYDATEKFCKKNLKVHIIGHVFGIHSCYRNLAINRNALLGTYKPTNGELNVMYHGFLVRDFYDDETMQQLYNDCLKEEESDSN